MRASQSPSSCWFRRRRPSPSWPFPIGPSIDELADANFIELIVDPADVRMFVECLAGPSAAPAPTIVGLSIGDCRNFFDPDADGDVDLRDFAAFQRGD